MLTSVHVIGYLSLLFTENAEPMLIVGLYTPVLLHVTDSCHRKIFPWSTVTVQSLRSLLYIDDYLFYVDNATRQAVIVFHDKSTCKNITVLFLQF